eukprot:gene7696-15673_t
MAIGDSNRLAAKTLASALSADRTHFAAMDENSRAVLNMELSWETTISSGSVASNVCDAKIGRATNATQG